MRCRRRSSSSRSSRSDSKSPDFRFPTGRQAGRENSIQEMARLHPGTLLEKGLQMMEYHCDPVHGSASGDRFPASAMKYLRNVLQVLDGANLGDRDMRELGTLASALDHLSRGNLAGLGDILIQRFKSIETAKKEGGNWKVGTQMELLPLENTGISSHTECRAAVRQTVQQAKLEDVLRNRPRGGGG